MIHVGPTKMFYFNAFIKSEEKGLGVMVPVVEHLCSKHEALSLNSNYTHTHTHTHTHTNRSEKGI
jgi:hypothetical protein